MLFIVHCLDRAGALPVRMDHYQAHREYLATLDSRPVEIVMSGPLVSDDGETMIGSFFLVAATGREAVEAFNQADPFHHAGIWESVRIHAFSKRVG
ncbi:MAG: YciI family protein [SAR324 cluster bacterium]|nr:YciI family protein [SAR324 cluster bacterium]